MPKLIDIAKMISGRINSNEFSAALSASDPFSIEIGEEEFEKIQSQVSGMMTLDSAVNNVEVAKAMKPKLKSEIEGDIRRELKNSMYTNIEEKISGLGPKLGIDLSGKKIDEQLDAISSHKAPTIDNKAYENLQNEFATYKEQTANDKENFKNELLDFKINSTLRNKLSSVPLSKPYQDDLVKSSLFDRVISEVKSKAVISLDDKTGQMKLLNPDNREMELFDENNKKIGIDDLINPLVQPYIQATPEKSQDKPEQNISISQLPDGMNYGSAAAQVKSAKSEGVSY